MRYFISILVLALAVGCSTSSRREPGLYLEYTTKAGHGVVGPLGSTALPFYDFRAQSIREQVTVSKIREDSSSVEVAFIYSITTGDVSTGPVEQFTFSKSEPTRVKLVTGAQVTGHFR